MDAVNLIGPVGIASGLIGSAAGLSYGAIERGVFNRERAFLRAEAERRARLEGALRLRPLGEQWPLPVGTGPIPIIGAGSAAAGLIPTFQRTFEQGSIQQILGPTLIVEPDDLISLPNCIKRIPPVYRDRLLVPPFPALGGGWGGRTVAEVYQEDALPLWREDLQPYEERFLSALRHQQRPPFLMAFISPGPSGSMIRPVLRAYADEHPTVPRYAIFVLDQDPRRRKLHLGQLLDLYSTDDLIDFWIILDNQHRDHAEFDNAAAAHFFSVVQGPWLQLSPKAGWNTLGDVHRLYHRQVATLRLTKTQLGVDYIEPYKDLLPPAWFTKGVYARLQLRRSIRVVLDEPQRQSLALPAARDPWIVSITSPIRPDPDLFKVQQSLASLSLEAHNGTLLLSSIGVPLAPATSDVDALTVGLVPIAGGLKAVRELATGKDQSVGRL